jgi:RHS repeat-associated protein
LPTLQIRPSKGSAYGRQVLSLRIGSAAPRVVRCLRNLSLGRSVQRGSKTGSRPCRESAAQPWPLSSSSSPAPLSPTAPRRTCPATPARYEAGGVWHTALTDLTGSPVESVGNAGAVSGVTHYGPYGAARPGSADPLGIGYVGEYRDATGLVNLRARSYEPVLARFIGRDTTGGVASAPQTANRYAYATDNPLRYTDPSGHFIAAIAADPGAAFGLAIGFTGLPGAVYYGVSAIVGRDLATGRTLEPWERSIGVVALAVIPGARLAEQAISLGGRMVASLGRVARTVAAAARESSAFGALTRRLASLGGRAAGLGGGSAGSRAWGREPRGSGHGLRPGSDGSGRPPGVAWVTLAMPLPRSGGPCARGDPSSFDSFFCESGERGAHEKGGVEGEVGRFRRRHLVPLPRVKTLAELNDRLAAADRRDLARHVASRRATCRSGVGPVLMITVGPLDMIIPSAGFSRRRRSISRPWPTAARRRSRGPRRATSRPATRTTSSAISPR